MDQESLLVLVKMLAAYVLVLPVAWDREQQARSMGLRTFPLVSVSCCGFALLARWEIAILLTVVSYATLYLVNRRESQRIVVPPAPPGG